MEIHIYHHHSWDEAPQEVSNLLSLILQNQESMMTTQADIAAALAKVQADVAAETTVEAGVATFIHGLQDQIATLAAQTTDATTASALNTLSTQIEANTASLSAAITTVPQAAAPAEAPSPAAPAAPAT